MLICPKCKNEYQEGYKICSDCKEELIEIPDIPQKTTISKDVSMKRTLIGITLLISSTFTYIGIIFCAAICGSQLIEMPNFIGVIERVLIENYLLLIPCIISAIIFVLGVIILLTQYYAKTEN